MKKHQIEAIKFYKAFEELAENTDNFESFDIKKIVGRADEYRLRLGKYRALFRLFNDELLILVIDIDSRGQIYK